MDREAEEIKKRMADQIRTAPAVTVTTLPVDLDDRSFESFVKGGKPVVVDFWAPWCGPCRFVSPVVEDLAKEYGDRVKFGKVNVDENPITANRFAIQSIPTIMYFKNGKPVDATIGALPRPMLERKVKALL